MITDRFNPAMLRLARDLRGMKQGDLAVKAGCTQGFVSQAEHAERAVSRERIDAFGRALGFPSTFFEQEGTYGGVGISMLFYRKKQCALAAHVNRLQAEVALRRIVVSRLLRGVSIGQPTRTFRFMDIDEFDGRADNIAEMLRASWEMPIGPIPNLIGVIENAGGIVFKFSFGTKDIDAMSQWPDDLPPLFFVNSDAPPDRVRFSLAHELGHVVMHRSASPEMESEADSFAAALLMPERDISTELAGINLERAASLKPYWRVSMGSLIKRARDLGRLEADRYTFLWREMSRYGYRKKEPVSIATEEPRFWNEIIKTYETGMGFNESALGQMNGLFPSDFGPRFMPRTSGMRLAM